MKICPPLAKVCQNIHKHPKVSLDGLKSLRIHNHSNIIVSYINVNPIRNKFDDLKLIIDENVDYYVLLKPKLMSLFQQFNLLCLVIINTID